MIFILLYLNIRFTLLILKLPFPCKYNYYFKFSFHFLLHLFSISLNIIVCKHLKWVLINRTLNNIISLSQEKLHFNFQIHLKLMCMWLQLILANIIFIIYGYSWVIYNSHNENNFKLNGISPCYKIFIWDRKIALLTVQFKYRYKLLRIYEYIHSQKEFTIYF